MKNIRKKALAVLLTAILVVGASPATGLFGLIAAAETVGGVCGAEGDNVTWSLDTDTGALTISGTGDMADYDDEDNAAPWAEDYNDVIESVTVGSGVTSIGDYAFYYHPALTSVTIGEDVTYIGESAFAFSSLTEVNIPASVSQIGLGAFLCMSISDDGDIAPVIQCINVDAGNTAFSSENGVLYNEAKTTLIQYPCGKPDTAFAIPGSVATIADAAFFLSLLLESVTIPDSVTEIGESAFDSCVSLEDVTFGSGVESVGIGAFGTCVSLQNVMLPDSVTEIGDGAFAECESLESLTLGSGVEVIGEDSFRECSALATLTIPESVTEIGKYAFSGCASLEKVTFNAVACSVMGSQNSLVFTGCIALQTVEIGNGVTMIPPYAFFGLDALTAVVIPAGVTSIGQGAFTNCSNLAEVTLSNGVESIGDAAFRSCAFESVHIPSTVTSIGVDAFGYCDNLAYICSDAADGAARAYAEANGIEYRNCSGEQPSNTVSGTCGAEGENVIWTLDLDTGAMIISGTGAMADYAAASSVPWAGYRESIQALTVESGVTSIGDRAFIECENLTNVAIGSDVKAIGDEAFEFCMNLSSVTLPDNLEKIGAMAFLYTGLTSVCVPSAVQEIGALAFVCVTESPDGGPAPALLRIDVDPENTAYISEDGVLYNKTKTTLIQYPCAKTQTEFAIPDSVTTVGTGAFLFCINLKKIPIPDSVTTIEEDAFEYCTSLQKVTIPNGVTEIAGSAFADCRSLADVTIPDGVTSIGDYAFDRCAFTGLTLPDSLTTIGSRAFCRCSNLESLHIPAGVTAIGDYAFDSCPSLSFLCCDTADCYAKTYAEANGITFRLCAGHESSATTISGVCGAEGDNVLWALNLGNGIMVISGTGAMADYAAADDAPWADYRASIQTVVVRSGVTSIGENAFFGCAPLTSVTIGEDVTAIGADAFAQSALTNAAIPRNVQQIGAGAFDCYTTSDGVMPTLQAFAVDPENESFSVTDGVLYDKTQTTLIRYPDAASRVTFIVPDTVTCIEAGAFKTASNLASIHVPPTVTAIGSDAFAFCDHLEYLCSNDENSYVKTYAAENDVAFHLCVGHDGATRIAGDVNGDGVVNLKDVVLMRRYLADGWDVAILVAAADVDADNAVTLQDVVLVCRYLAGGWSVVLI